MKRFRPLNNGDRNPVSGGVSRGSRLISWGVLLIFIGVGMVMAFSPIREWFTPVRVNAYFSVIGWAAPLAFVLGAGVLMAIGLPRLLLCSLGGVLFGFFWGLLWSLAATLLGSYATFVFVRRCGRDSALTRWPVLRRFSERVSGEKGVLTVVLVRQIPISGFYNNALLAMTYVGHGDFLIGSLLGYLPAGIPAVMVGAGLIHADLATFVQHLVIAVAVAMGLAFATRWLLRSHLVLGRKTKLSKLTR